MGRATKSSMAAGASTSAFDVKACYKDLLSKDENLAMPLASMKALASVIEHSGATTFSELFSVLREASETLANESYDPISLSCGASLLLRYITLQRPSPSQSFADFKSELVGEINRFMINAESCRGMIAERTSDFIDDGATILVHGHSRVVTQALLHAAHAQNKRLRVYTTESRPFGLGVKTHAVLTSAQPPVECEVVLDSAVAYIMAKVDMCLVGAEAICESGGLINFIGGLQVAIAARAFGKPVYALAESFKMTRLFPLSNYDLPTSRQAQPLTFQQREQQAQRPANLENVPRTPSRPLKTSSLPPSLHMSEEMVLANPLLDYTTPDLVQLIVTDLGAFTPSGVSDLLLGIYGGE